MSRGSAHKLMPQRCLALLPGQRELQPVARPILEDMAQSIEEARTVLKLSSASALLLLLLLCPA